MIANTAKWEKYDTFPDHDFQIIRKTMAAADIFLLGSQHTRAVNQHSRSFDSARSRVKAPTPFLVESIFTIKNLH